MRDGAKPSVPELPEIAGAVQVPEGIRADLSVARKFAMEEWDSPEEAIAFVCVKLGVEAQSAEIARQTGRPIEEIEALRKSKRFARLLARASRILAFTPEKAIQAEQACFHRGIEVVMARLMDPAKVSGERTTDIVKALLGLSQANQQHLRNIQTVKGMTSGKKQEPPQSHRELLYRFFSSEEGIEYFKAQVDAGDARALALLEEYEGREVPVSEIADVMERIADEVNKKSGPESLELGA